MPVLFIDLAAKVTRWIRQIFQHYADKVKLTAETCFAGLDGYKKMISCDVNLVILATSPQFRPVAIPGRTKLI